MLLLLLLLPKIIPTRDLLHQSAQQFLDYVGRLPQVLFVTVRGGIIAAGTCGLRGMVDAV